ncbi:hypothetical protein [Sandarakinorhabdus sp.]|uniref:hypothetical protein n=1 Tax=Sandarakinorhabdus sp. TaxID=1916663 RepID=UPI003569EC3B
MLANNAVTILMIVFTYALVLVPVVWFFTHGPRQLDARKQRKIAQLVSGAELLADALTRNGNDPVHVARLQAQYDAHARALTQLNGEMPSLITVPAPLKQAA